MHKRNIHDRCLKAVYKLMERVRTEFFRLSDLHKNGATSPDGQPLPAPDTRFILKQERLRILQDVVVFFDGIFPPGQDPTRSKLAQIAQAFGAEVAQTVDSRVTHVLSLQAVTEPTSDAIKLFAGATKRPACVSVNWLLDSLQLYTRCSEQGYLVFDQNLRIEDFHKKFAHLIDELHTNTVQGWDNETRDDAEGSTNKRLRTWSESDLKGHSPSAPYTRQRTASFNDRLLSNVAAASNSNGPVLNTPASDPDDES